MLTPIPSPDLHVGSYTCDVNVMARLLYECLFNMYDADRNADAVNLVPELRTLWLVTLSSLSASLWYVRNNWECFGHNWLISQYMRHFQS